MKKIFVLVMVISLVLLGCSPNKNKDSDIINQESIAFNEGVIEHMDLEDLFENLSKFNTSTTMTDVVDIFGEEPCMIVEANSNIWEYYIGNIVVTLYGIDLYGGTLYEVWVSCGGASISIQLQ